MKKIITVICCSVCCAICAAQGTYSLDQLKQLAVENNYALRSARTGVEVYIANARYPIEKILSGAVNRTRIAIV